ncbi:SDR family NAD(P)-dependent oxidoreductase [Comamonadaceae bacterium G21597-S1]|nr:SDR family NAD(P)-dependent oxidoreductase [Comamonadaceae bacterium G21597-S1]
MPLNPAIRDWHGRTVWLVGASTGIGRATASLLHARGARVIVSARSTDTLEQFVAEHDGARAMPLDVTDRDAVRTAMQAIARDGGLDGMVYCAGHYTAMDPDAIDLDDMVRHVDINYTGALTLLDAVLPHLLGERARKPFVSLVGSVAGYGGLPRSLAYGPTKAALINLAQTLYLGLRNKGVGVSIINPGFVETPLTAQNSFHMPALLTPEQAAQYIVKGWERGAFEIHFPKRFTLGLKLLSLLPYRLYFTLVGRIDRG